MFSNCPYGINGIASVDSSVSWIANCGLMRSSSILCTTSLYLNDLKDVRLSIVMKHENSPWFKAYDIDAVLEYRHALRADHRKEYCEIGDPGHENPYTAFVNAIGLSQWLSSTIETPVAAAFKRWMTGELLPTIRATHILQV
ncbi:hypothetical protein CDAR_61681 [Caerostris darwini]|uniref:Bro-N domain-containing protein n=1 Tax=Caerostris darwini TaxID=1538125 RepID=A0AAV4NUH4_9ARAC|nr:hypothetical protein CDAR_61681 [Caerostris darwini]